MNRFNQLNFFHSESFLKEAARISAEKQENRDLFSEIFSTKDPGLVISIADQFYSVFRKTFGDKEEYFAAAQSLKGSQIGSVIRQIRNNKIADPKEAKLEEITKSYPQPKDPQYSDNIKALKESEVNPSHYNWIFKMLFNEEADPIEEIIKAVYFYQRNQSELERPLESFELLSELRSYFDEKLASNKEYYYSKIEKHALDPKYTDYIYQSDNFVTVLSGTTQSSQYWARGTTWCTGYLERNQFANYSSKNIYLYYVITKQDSELFKKSNPMRKISIGYVKADGKPQLLTKENATVNTDNHNLSLNQIQEYLGSEADSIISAIYADLNGREDTKFNEIIAETTPEELERQLAEINDDSQITSILLQFTQNNVARADTKRVAAKNLAEKRPFDFFRRGLHKIPEYAEVAMLAAKNLAEKSPRDFFYYFFHYGLDKLPEYAEVEMLAAKNLAEKNPFDFFRRGLHKIPEYAEFGRPVAANLAEKSPEDLFVYGLHKIPEYAEIVMLAAKNLAEKNPGDFFRYGLGTLPEYAEFKIPAAKNLAEKNPFDFFRRGLHRIPECAEFGIPAAKNWAEKSPEDFFVYGLHKIPEYAEIVMLAAKNLAEKSPISFFYYNLHKISEYAEFGIPTAKNWAEKSPEYFFYYNLHEIPEYAHLNPNNEAPEENKLQSLEAWLRTNGFRREAKELSTLFC